MNARRQVLRLFVASAFSVGSVVAFSFYESYTMKSFCSDLPDSATPETVMALAKSKGLLPFDVMEARGTISVLNHANFAFRYACDVEFKDGRQVRKSVITAD